MAEATALEVQVLALEEQLAEVRAQFVSNLSFSIAPYAEAAKLLLRLAVIEDITTEAGVREALDIFADFGGLLGFDPEKLRSYIANDDTVAAILGVIRFVARWTTIPAKSAAVAAAAPSAVDVTKWLSLVSQILKYYQEAISLLPILRDRLLPAA